MFSAGDYAPWFRLPDQNGKNLFLRDEVGQPILLLFQGSDTNPENVELLKTFQKALPLFTNANAKVVAISPDEIETRKAVAEKNNISFRLLSDSELGVSQLYHVCESSEDGNFPNILFALDQNLMMFGIFPNVTPEQFPTILSSIKSCCPKQEPYVVRDVYTPPVLIIPDVIDPESCKKIINMYETKGNQVSHFMRSDGDKTYGVVDANVKIRRDHFVRDPDDKEFINRFLQRRVYPQIEKCFNYNVFEYEHFKIACYDSATGGYFRAHRDNTSKGTAHRKWAFSMNLNAEEYEGGHLTFSEYGSQLYKPPTGTAVIFSCSLMHEAMNVTAGKRYALLSFFYGEAESRARAEYLQTYGSDNYVPKEVSESLQYGAEPSY